MSKSIDAIEGWRGSSRWFNRIARLFRCPVRAKNLAKTQVKGSPTPGPAPSMMMMSRDIGPLVDRTAERLADWQQRRSGRRQLMGLDDRELKDLGISRCDAEQEYGKPFWRR